MILIRTKKGKRTFFYLFTYMLFLEKYKSFSEWKKNVLKSVYSNSDITISFNKKRVSLQLKWLIIAQDRYNQMVWIRGIKMEMIESIDNKKETELKWKGKDYAMTKSVANYISIPTWISFCPKGFKSRER